jgi:hypothetical protein
MVKENPKATKPIIEPYPAKGTLFVIQKTDEITTPINDVRLKKTPKDEINIKGVAL